MLRVLIVLPVLFQSLQADIDYDSKLQVKLEHSLDDTSVPNFEFRGEVAIKSLHSGSIGMDQIQLNANELNKLKQLARNNENYRLKATVKTPDGRSSTFYTFTSACAMLSSQLNDVIYINVDHVGNVVAVSLSTKEPCSDYGLNTTGEFLTSIYIKHMEMGPVPDTASYVQKLEREREAKDRGETKDNRSFLAKYWMYIVPVVIFVLVSSASGPEGAAGGQ